MVTLHPIGSPLNHEETIKMACRPSFCGRLILKPPHISLFRALSLFQHSIPSPLFAIVTPLIFTIDIMLSSLYILSCLCFWFAVVSAQVNLAQIIASNEDLQEQSTNADKDVNDVTIVDGLDIAPVRCVVRAETRRGLTAAIQRVTQDLAGINAALETVIADAEQVTPTGDGGDESSVTSSFSSVSFRPTQRKRGTNNERSLPINSSPTP